MPKNNHEKLQEYVNKIRDQTLTDEEFENLQSLLMSLQASIASGDRSDAFGRSADGAYIRTGDTYNTIPPEAVALFFATPYKPNDLTDFDQLQKVGSLPPGSRMPFTRNASFIGREGELLRLAKAQFGSSEVTAVTQSLAGMGGIGKTQLAVEFCFRYGRFFHGVHWINAAQPEGIQAELAACGEGMALPRWPQERAEQIKATLKAWAQSGPRLLVLDNLEDVEAAREILKTLVAGGDIRVLITARLRSWPKDIVPRTHELGVFSEEEAHDFLRKGLKNKRKYPDKDLKELAKRLGRLPLALELAGRYVGRLKISVQGYLEQLEEVLEDEAMQNWEPEYGNPTDHDLSLRATFELSWKAIEDEDQRRMFRLASWCAANQVIPTSLLGRALVELEEVELAKALLGLDDVGLISYPEETEGPTLHLLLSEFGRSVSEEDDLENIAKALAEEANEKNNTGYPRDVEPLRPHLERLAPLAEAHEIKIAASLWNDLGFHQKIVADFAVAKQSYERALKIGEAVYGPDHPEVAPYINNLGDVLHDQGDLEGAKVAIERALAIGEAVYGPDHPTVAIYVNNLGGVLRDQGDLEGAKTAYERALKIDEAEHGPDHPEVAIRVNNLGLVLHDQGDLEGAKAAIERALKIGEAEHGPDHPTVGAYVNNLGGVLHDQGDLEGAKTAYERALKIDEAAYGPDHPEVATEVNNLGGVLRDQGDLEGAKAAFERALKIDDAAYGPDHPKVAIRVNNLGLVLKAQGDLEGAKAAFERAIRILEQFLPEDHPKLLTARRNLENL